MSYGGTVLRRATERLAARRTAREASQDALRMDIYEKLPLVAAIDRQLRGTAARIIRSALAEGSDPGAGLAVLKAENLSKQAQRARLLTEGGYSADALDGRALCQKCGDTGWRGAEMCDCLKQLCAQEQIKELSQTLDFGEQSFDLFDFSYYGEDYLPNGKVTARQSIQQVYRICYDYAHNFGKFALHNLFLSGEPGLGKTFLSACIARTVSESGFSVVYDTAGSIFSQFETQKFSRDADDFREARDGTRRYLGCDLLILDDLGSEMTTPFVQAALYQLLNARLLAARRTVISSNLTMDEVRRRYSPQIASRLEGEYRVLPFFGEDIRRQKKKRL